MRIADVIKAKGDGVVTVAGGEPVSRLLELLNEHGFGALVVSDDGVQVQGIVSERDVVRRLHSEGAQVLDGPVSAIMTSRVHTASEDDEVESLASMMTQHRIRHVPIVDADGRLRAIVSIGDVVKSRIEQLEHEQAHLVDYLHGS